MSTGNILRSGAGALLAQGAMHLQLLRVEWALEKLRYKRMLNLMLATVALFICSMLSLGMLVMLLFWNTQFRIAAALALVALYGCGTACAYYRLQQEDATGNNAFADSSREIAADLALLRDRIAG